MLHAAFFPVRELLERCRRSLGMLAPVGDPPRAERQPPTGRDGSAVTSGEQGAPPILPAAAAGKSSSANWARAGIEAVCRALAAAAALPGDGAAFPGETAPRESGGSAAGDGGGESGSGAGDASVVSDGSGDGSGRGDKTGESDCADGGGRDATPSATAAPMETASSMMDLDDLERLLGGEGPPQPCPKKPSEGRAGEPLTVASDAAAASVCDASLGSGLGGVPQTGQVNQDDGDAWEMVEAWTPCAIGTLPGWSAARLY